MQLRLKINIYRNIIKYKKKERYMTRTNAYTAAIIKFEHIVHEGRDIYRKITKTKKNKW